jgi:hypothetical protein
LAVERKFAISKILGGKIGHFWPFCMSPLGPHLLTRKKFVKSEWRPLWPGAMSTKIKKWPLTTCRPWGHTYWLGKL